jgi:hypothetical protein
MPQMIPDPPQFAQSAQPASLDVAICFIRFRGFAAKTNEKRTSFRAAAGGTRPLRREQARDRRHKGSIAASGRKRRRSRVAVTPW